MVTDANSDDQPFSPHILRRYINWLHIAGLVSIPNYYHEPWKNRFHGYYNIGVSIYLALFGLTIALSVFINAIQDFGEFSIRLWEFICYILAFVELLYVRRNLDKWYELLSLIEQLTQDHGRHPFVVRLQRMQKLFLYFSLGVIYTIIMGSRVLQTFLPPPASTMARTKLIYKLKNPQYVFIIPRYIPGVDTSETHVFLLISFLDFAVEVWSVLTIVVSITFFTFLAHDIQAYMNILAEFTSRIGEQLQRNEDGQVVIYTSLLRNKYIVETSQSQETKSVENKSIIVVETKVTDNNQATTSTNQPIKDPKMTMLEAKLERKKDTYDYFYVKQIVLFQEKLTDITDKMYDFYSTTLKIRAVIAILLIFLSVLIILNPASDVPFFLRLQINGEASAMCMVFSLFFYSGELLAECNLTLRTAAYCSGWYNCARKPRKAVCLFLTRNINMNYFVMFEVMRLDYDLMVRIFNGGYTFLNFIINQRSRFD